MKKLIALFAMIALAIIVPVSLHAWGPEREEKWGTPVTKIRFNSFVDSPIVGDERNFVNIREVGTANVWHDTINVESGKEYYVRMYVHNDAAENLPNNVAENVNAMFYLPKESGKSLQVNGFLSASNSDPKKIDDFATFTSSKEFKLAYVNGSLLYQNNGVGAHGGVALPESIFTSNGARIGYESLESGKIPGCLKYDAYLGFKVRPIFNTESTFKFEKKVSKHGANQWTESYTAKPGEVVDFLVEYSNTGNTVQRNVNISDTLPAGLTYKPGFAFILNGKYKTLTKTSDDIVKSTGANIGSYGSGSNAIEIFSAQVADNDKLANCGNNTLVNKAKITVEGKIVEDTANVVVTKTCTTPVVPVTPVTPETPEQLPHTGPAENFAAILGVSSLVTVLGYVLTSRRGLYNR